MSQVYTFYVEATDETRFIKTPRPDQTAMLLGMKTRGDVRYWRFTEEVGIVAGSDGVWLYEGGFEEER